MDGPCLASSSSALFASECHGHVAPYKILVRGLACKIIQGLDTVRAMAFVDGQQYTVGIDSKDDEGFLAPKKKKDAGAIGLCRYAYWEATKRLQYVFPYRTVSIAYPDRLNMAMTMVVAVTPRKGDTY